MEHNNITLKAELNFCCISSCEHLAHVSLTDFLGKMFYHIFHTELFWFSCASCWCVDSSLCISFCTEDIHAENRNCRNFTQDYCYYLGTTDHRQIERFNFLYWVLTCLKIYCVWLGGGFGQRGYGCWLQCSTFIVNCIVYGNTSKNALNHVDSMKY